MTVHVTAGIPLQQQHQRPVPARDGVREQLAALETARLEQLTALGTGDTGPVAAAYRASVLRILDEVRLARRRLDDGSYGLCTGCSTAIAPELLRLRVWSTRCEACAN